MFEKFFSLINWIFSSSEIIISEKEIEYLKCLLNQLQISKTNDLREIYDELNIYLEKIYKLTELENNNDIEKVKKYTN